MMVPVPLTLVNTRTADALAAQVEIAVSRQDRTQGLLGRDRLAPSTALILAPCSAIHTLFMRFDIDAVFVDGEGRVVKVVEDLPPWRIAARPFAHAVIEMAAGSLDPGRVEVGDRLRLVDGNGAESTLSLDDLRNRL